MNDPNGMFYKDGTYHLYFQYYLRAISGAYALGTREYERFALDRAPHCYLSAAVIDTFNVAAAWTAPLPSSPCTFTASGDIQTQGISYSDGGMTYEFYEGNPVP